jgi:glycosyltransferase involved in cell wall biosynthesis
VTEVHDRRAPATRPFDRPTDPGAPHPDLAAPHPDLAAPHPDLALVPGDGTSSVGASLLETSTLEDVATRALAVGLRHIHVVAWRDLDDPEAGGSELHAHHVASQWAAAGIDVTVRTSAAAGHPWRAERNGYHVVRKSGRYAVFPRSALSGLVGKRGRPDGLVEIWNGMPFWSPLWARCPSVVFLHHVHAEMWRMVLPPALARIGELVERRFAPPLYRRSRILTLSESSRREIVSMLGFRPDRVTAVPPGLDPRFTPGGTRSPVPLVVAVGRLVPVKRFDLLIDALLRVRAAVPDARAQIVGEGYVRPALEARLRAAGAEAWIELPGYVDEDGLLDAYRRAWVVASTSQREGWGMTVTEAGACGTPSVATRIAGHTDAVVDGVSGLLVDGRDAGPAVPEANGAHGTRSDLAAGLARALTSVLTDDALRARLARGARVQALALSWERTAARTLQALVDEASGRRR